MLIESCNFSKIPISEYREMGLHGARLLPDEYKHDRGRRQVDAASECYVKNDAVPSRAST